MFIGLIEDNESIAQMIKAALEMQSHTLMHFFDGASFLASLQTSSYDFALVDFNLPGAVSGLEVISFLQENMPYLPILVITGVSESFLAVLRTLYPLIPILRKPFHLQALLYAIEMVKKPTANFDLHS